MGSAQQLIVGGLLLTTAFLFGRYLTDPQGGEETQVTSEAKPLNLQRQSDNTPSTLPKRLDLSLGEGQQRPEASDPQRSLRERIIGQREKRQQEQNDSVAPQPDSAPSLLKRSSSDTSSDDIVFPDFSHLEQPAQLPSTAADQFSRPSRTQASKPSPHSSMPRLSDASPRRDSEVPLDRDVQPIGDLFESPEYQAPSQSNIAIAEATEHRPKSPPRHANSVMQPKMPKRDLSTQRRVQRKTSTRANLVAVQSKDRRLTIETDEFQTYETVFGDTLHSLSTKFFGKPDYYLDIYLANRDVFKNPADVPVNTKIRIPVHKNQP